MRGEMMNDEERIEPEDEARRRVMDALLSEKFKASPQADSESIGKIISTIKGLPAEDAKRGSVWRFARVMALAATLAIVSFLAVQTFYPGGVGVSKDSKVKPSTASGTPKNDIAARPPIAEPPGSGLEKKDIDALFNVVNYPDRNGNSSGDKEHALEKYESLQDKIKEATVRAIVIGSVANMRSKFAGLSTQEQKERKVAELCVKLRDTYIADSSFKRIFSNERYFDLGMKIYLEQTTSEERVLFSPIFRIFIEKLNEAKSNEDTTKKKHNSGFQSMDQKP